jgi:hypothetical protein
MNPEDAAPQAQALAERLRPDDLPRLALFLSTYLHENLEVAHGSAAHAAWDYASEAELDELEELRDDWEVLRAAARALPLARVNELLRERFGSTWQAASSAEIEQVAEQFERALRE